MVKKKKLLHILLHDLNKSYIYVRGIAYTHIKKVYKVNVNFYFIQIVPFFLNIFL